MKSSQILKEGNLDIGYLSSDFHKAFDDMEVTESKKIPSFKVLPKNMNDHEIKSELDVTECMLGDLLAFFKHPPEGTKDGNWNIFYISGRVVSVRWRAGLANWDGYVWPLGHSGWFAGGRGFSGNLISEPKKEHLDTLPLELIINSVKYRRV